MNNSEIYVLYQQASQYESMEILGYVTNKSTADFVVGFIRIKHPSWSIFYKVIYPFRRTDSESKDA